jgi:putative sigma-54 modulation protein
MEINIKGHNLQVTEALNSYAQKKLERLDRYLPNIVDVRVELGRENTRRGENLSVAQITVRHRRGAILRAQEKVAGEMEAALNLAVDKMYRQIERFKGKRSRKGNGRFAATLEELGIAEANPEVTVDIEREDESTDAQVIRRKDVAVTAMSEEEAIEQMELLGHTFFVFFNPATANINVIYKRRSEGYGVLNPQVE